MSDFRSYISGNLEVLYKEGTGFYLIELSDMDRRRQGKGLLLLTRGELAELCDLVRREKLT